MIKCAHFNYGERNDIAFIFSCAGKKELENCLPVSGKTGENLEIFLKYIPKSLIGTYKNRYDFRISNASNKVFYYQKDGRTEAKSNEILNDSNRNRLLNEIRDINTVIFCFGKKAKLIIDNLINLKGFDNNSVKVYYFRHLGLQSLNRYKVVNKNLINPTIEDKIKDIIESSGIQKIYPE